MESEYHVTWSANVQASSPEDAARKALAMQRDPEAAARRRIFVIHAGARILSIEVSASGVTSHVIWDSDHQEDDPDLEYTPEFWALPPEQQLQWRITHYLMERLIIPEVPDSDGWRVDCVNTADAVQGDPLITGFVIHTPPGSTGPSFRVSIEMDDSRSPDVTGE
jgi:hypothetical protein